MERDEKGRIAKGSGGRPPGTANKTTKVVREAFAAFVEANMDRVQELFDEVASEDPAKALDILDRFAAYTTPKLKAIDHTSEGKQLPTVVIRAPQAPDA